MRDRASSPALAQDTTDPHGTPPPRAVATTFSVLGVSSSGASVLTSTDDGTAALSLPFPFTFYDITYPGLC